MAAAVLRNLILRSGERKRLHENFMPACFIRDVGDPMAIRRKPAAVLSRFGSDDNRRCRLRLEGITPDVVIGGVGISLQCNKGQRSIWCGPELRGPRSFQKTFRRP